MKKKIKKWSLRIVGFVLMVAIILTVLVLNPGLLYANKTIVGNYTIYHNAPIDSGFTDILLRSQKLISTSEIYNPDLKMNICPDDGSKYQALIQILQGPAFGYGFFHNVVIRGKLNCKENYTEYHGYKWNLTQLLAHEQVHCLQYDKFGFWKSNPVAKYPDWKWDGYNEYIARQNEDQRSLSKNIARLVAADKSDKDAWGISFSDSTFIGKDYYRWWILMQYCKDVKKMSYQEILKDTTSEEHLRDEMMKGK